MKYKFFEDKYFKISFYAFAVIAISILFEKFLGVTDVIFMSLCSSLKFLVCILEPFIFGSFIAYFLDPITNWLEEIIFIKLKGRRKRLLAVVTTYLIFIGLLIWSLIYFVPEFVDNIQKLILITPSALQKLSGIKYGFLYELIDKLNHVFGTSYNLSDICKITLTPLLKSISGIKDMSNEIITRTFGLASSILNFVLGLVIAFYMLCDKNKLIEAVKKLVYIIFGEKKSRKIITSLGEYNSVFKKFIVGKSIDSLIVGVLFFIMASFIKLPYLFFLSLIIGVTNMIPYFGPFIGSVPVILIALLNKPILAIWSTIIILVLQQFDGIILGPKILGDSTGLKPIEVIFAIIIGGALFGILGMFFGVPVFAVILRLLKNITEEKFKAMKARERNQNSQ